MDLNLVNRKDLSEEEILWLNQYHQQVIEALNPLLDGEESEWLEKAARKI